jgi:serine/threonine protein kinase
VGIGTPEYMAPEQGMGASAIDARADIYSLGIVLYEMVTGRKPYIADTPMAVVLKQMSDPLPRPCDFVPDLPERVEHILFKALAKQPEDRYTDMNAFIAAMEMVLFDVPEAKTTPLSKRSKKQTVLQTRPKHRVVVASIGLAGVLVLVLFVGALWSIKKFIPIQSTTGMEITSTTGNLASPTSTLELSASPTSTKNPRVTPIVIITPVWVTEFAEPILAAIQNREPDFQDDFSIDTQRWYGGYGQKFTIAEGVMCLQEGVTVSNYYYLYKHNSVFQMDILDPIKAAVAITLSSHSFEDSPFKFQLDPDHQWSVRHNPDSFSINYGMYKGEGQKTRITVIEKETRVAYYINGNPIVYYENPDFLLNKKNERQLECSKTCCFDNVKFWNLDNIQNLP